MNHWSIVISSPEKVAMSAIHKVRFILLCFGIVVLVFFAADRVEDGHGRGEDHERGGDDGVRGFNAG